MLKDTDAAVHDLPDSPVLVQPLQAVPPGSVPPVERNVAGGTGSEAEQDGFLAGPSIPLTARVVPDDQLVPVTPVDLLTFFEPRTIGQALAAAGWTPTRDVELLAQIAETGESDKDRILAMRELRVRVREALESTGELGRFGVSETEDDDGGTRRTVSVSSGLSSTLGALADKFKRNKPKEEAPGGPPTNEARPNSVQTVARPEEAAGQDGGPGRADGVLDV